VKRIVKRFDLSTSVTVCYDDQSKKYSVHVGECAPKRVEVEAVLIRFSTGAATYEKTGDQQ
jgi:hypothetical protein